MSRDIINRKWFEEQGRGWKNSANRTNQFRTCTYSKVATSNDRKLFQMHRLDENKWNLKVKKYQTENWQKSENIYKDEKNHKIN